MAWNILACFSILTDWYIFSQRLSSISMGISLSPTIILPAERGYWDPHYRMPFHFPKPYLLISRPCSNGLRLTHGLLFLHFSYAAPHHLCHAILIICIRSAMHFWCKQPPFIPCPSEHTYLAALPNGDWFLSFNLMGSELDLHEGFENKGISKEHPP